MQLWWQQFLLIFLRTNVIFCTKQACYHTAAPILIGRHPMRSFSPGAVAINALWKSAPMSCGHFCMATWASHGSYLLTAVKSCVLRWIWTWVIPLWMPKTVQGRWIKTAWSWRYVKCVDYWYCNCCITDFCWHGWLQMYSVSAKIVKPPGEKPDEFESTISQVSFAKIIGKYMSKISSCDS